MNRLTASDVAHMGWRGLRNRVRLRKALVLSVAREHHDLYHAPLNPSRATACFCPWGPRG